MPSLTWLCVWCGGATSLRVPEAEYLSRLPRTFQPKPLFSPIAGGLSYILLLMQRPSERVFRYFGICVCVCVLGAFCEPKGSIYLIFFEYCHGSFYGQKKKKVPSKRFLFWGDYVNIFRLCSMRVHASRTSIVYSNKRLETRGPSSRSSSQRSQPRNLPLSAENGVGVLPWVQRGSDPRSSSASAYPQHHDDAAAAQAENERQWMQYINQLVAFQCRSLTEALDTSQKRVEELHRQLERAQAERASMRVPSYKSNASGKRP